MVSETFATAKPPQPGGRLAFVDTLRGLAVVWMILWHTVDGWLTDAPRQTSTFELLRLLGGLAAPSFLLLAGAAVTLKLASDARRDLPIAITRRGILFRGIEIIAIGYVMRSAMWGVDVVGRGDLYSMRAVAPLTLGYLAFFIGLARTESRRTRGRELLLASLVLLGIGVWQLYAVMPARAPNLLRVDVLHAIGLSTILVVLYFEHVPAHARTSLGCAMVALAIALLSPILTEHAPLSLPTPIRGYFVRVVMTPPEPGAPLFPIFPWLAYAFAGAAIGIAWDRALRAQRLFAFVWRAALIGAIVAVACKEGSSWNRVAIDALPLLQTTSRTLYRIGIVMVLALASYGVAARGGLAQRTLGDLGKASLVVYCVHMDFAYGFSSKPLRKALDLQSWLLGFIALTFVMVLVARLRLGPWEKLRIALENKGWI